MQKLLQNETTDEHGAAEPQPKKSRRRRVRTLPGNLRVLCGREKKCIAGFQPAKVVLTQKELSRLRCRRDAGATIFSHDLCLRGEQGAWILLDLGFPQLSGLVMALRRVCLSYGLRRSSQAGKARA